MLTSSVYISLSLSNISREKGLRQICVMQIIWNTKISLRETKLDTNVKKIPERSLNFRLF